MQKTKKIAKLLLLITVTTLCMGGIASAKVTVLDWWSSNTYVTSEHGDSYWADTYTGTVSIKGTDRKYNGSRYLYPVFSRITYNVQGDITKKQVNSRGGDDNVRKIATVIVKDKWNFGAKTKALANISGAIYNGSVNTIQSRPGEAPLEY